MGFRARPAGRTSRPNTYRTPWHVGFAILVREGAPPGWQVRPEVALSLHPRRIDQLLVRLADVERRDEEAGVLHGLWPHLGELAILEFKSPTRGFRGGDLAHLLSYGYQYSGEHIAGVEDPAEIGLVLVVPTMTRTLAREIGQFELTLERMEGGYVHLCNGLYTVIVVLLDEVADAERNDLLSLFTDARTVANPEAVRWMYTWMMEEISMGNLQNLEGFDEFMVKVLRSLNAAQMKTVLAGLSPEQRLAGLAPEQRLAGIEPDELVDALRSLPEEVQNAIREAPQPKGRPPRRRRRPAR